MKVTRGKQIGHDEDMYLMVRAAAGDKVAYERLYRKYFPFITNYFKSFCLYPDSVSDLTQEVFSRIWQSRQRYQPRATFKAYIYGVARKVLLKERTRLAKTTALNQARLEGHSQTLAGASSDPEFQARQTESKETIKQLIVQLTAKQKEALKLFYSKEMSLQEAARHADCSVEAFRSRVRQAREQLRRLLRHREPAQKPFGTSISKKNVSP
jgi:RNA polymerase sigma-70 factor (ECF subfamily)